jgi:dihydrofolate reductase
MGHPVVMGRKTWQSLPFKLPGRTNLVVSRQHSVPANAKGESPDLLASSLEDALAQAALAPGGEAIFVIGGAQLYALALPRADRLALTQIQHPFEGDTLFPDLDLAQWTVTLHEAHHHEGDPSFDYLFLDLQRNASQGEP